MFDRARGQALGDLHDVSHLLGRGSRDLAAMPQRDHTRATLNVAATAISLAGAARRSVWTVSRADEVDLDLVN